MRLRVAKQLFCWHVAGSWVLRLAPSPRSPLSSLPPLLRKAHVTSAYLLLYLRKHAHIYALCAHQKRRGWGEGSERQSNVIEKIVVNTFRDVRCVWVVLWAWRKGGR